MIVTLPEAALSVAELLALLLQAASAAQVATAQAAVTAHRARRRVYVRLRTAILFHCGFRLLASHFENLPGAARWTGPSNARDASAWRSLSHEGSHVLK